VAGNQQTLTTRLVVDDEASRPTEEYAKILDGLDGETATVVLALKAASVKQDLDQMLADIAELDDSDPTISVKVEQAAQAKAELDDIGAKIQEINNAPVDVDATPAVKGVKDLGSEADNSRSVLANMAGNTAQDIGEIGGVAGTAGVAIGQLAEYAADGNISLSGLAKMAGPMLALSAVTMGLTLQQKRNAEQAKKSAEALKDLSSVAEDAIGGTFAQAITQGLLAGQKLDDILNDLVESNLEGAKRTLEWGESHGMAAGMVDELRTRIEEEERAIAQGDATKEKYKSTTEQTTEALEAERDAAQAAGEAALASVDAYRAAADANFALREATRDLTDTVAALPAKLAEAGGDLNKIQAAYDDVAQSAGRVADETVRVAEEQATASGTTLDAKGKLDLWNRTMLESASTLKGPARDAILGYIADVNGIPPEKVSEISAALDTGSVDTAATALDTASKARTAAMTADASTATAEKDLNETARDRVAKIQVQATGDTAWWQRAVNAPAPRSVAPQTINVNLPRGSRSSDLSRAMSAHTRRAGRRYGAPVVTRAR
jgi:hypothetical protein